MLGIVENPRRQTYGALASHSLINDFQTITELPIFFWSSYDIIQNVQAFIAVVFYRQADELRAECAMIFHEQSAKYAFDMISLSIPVPMIILHPHFWFAFMIFF